MKNIIIGLLTFIAPLAMAEFRPQSIKDLRDTSVRIMNLQMNSGGTGSIFRSFKKTSIILTNKHVCRLIEPGGYVVTEKRKYLITHYKKFQHHDLCLVRIARNLNINLVVADKLAKPAQTVYVSGHPNLLPHIATKGHLSSNVTIELVVGLKECTEEDAKNHPLECVFFGGVPVIEKFSSDVVSNLIKPGSSGSAVFNSQGEIVGVVYAGNGREFSHGYIVPHIHVLYFIQNSRRYPWVKVGTPVDDGGLRDRIFNFEKCYNSFLIRNGQIEKICKRVKNPMIWRK